MWWLYTILIDQKKYGMHARRLMQDLAKEKVQARPLWQPLHSQAIFKKSFSYKIEVSTKLYDMALSLPSSVGLLAKEQDKVISIIKGN
ncbi:MAG: DegT/DnrJ/EryC1/StrS family aminotransferase [Candidatus Omnitrophica bacterium]|nr:DegT/DnrJ/EryC1/StrS family aminotransferase [Candidatus Omnitrophota bacterium]